MNERDVRLTYRFLGHKKETEVRTVDPYLSKATSIFVTTEDEFVRVCRENDGKRNVYVGINERSPSGTTCKDVIHLNAIVLDIDSAHPKNSPATVSEREKSYGVALSVYNYLRDAGKIGFMAMSGNGWQIWYKMDIELGEDKKKLEAVIKDFQREISERFSTDYAKIDNIGDLARVIKVIGTTSIKPEPSESRPNVLSEWLRKPVYVRPNKEWGDKLMRLASTYIVSSTDDSEIGTVERLDEEAAKKLVSKFNTRMKDFFEGHPHRKYKSKSEAEFALVIMLAKKGFPKELTYALMSYSKIGKWNTENGSYKRLTINKAYELAKDTGGSGTPS